MGDGNDLNYISLLLVDNGERKSVEQDPANPLREGSTALWCHGDPIDRCVNFLDESHGSALAPLPVPLNGRLRLSDGFGMKLNRPWGH